MKRKLSIQVISTAGFVLNGAAVLLNWFGRNFFDWEPGWIIPFLVVPGAILLVIAIYMVIKDKIKEKK